MPQYPADQRGVPANTQVVHPVASENYATDSEDRFSGFMFREVGVSKPSERQVPTDTYVPGAAYDPEVISYTREVGVDPRSLLVD